MIGCVTKSSVFCVTDEKKYQELLKTLTGVDAENNTYPVADYPGDEPNEHAFACDGELNDEGDSFGFADFAEELRKILPLNECVSVTEIICENVFSVGMRITTITPWGTETRSLSDIEESERRNAKFRSIYRYPDAEKAVEDAVKEGDAGLFGYTIRKEVETDDASCEDVGKYILRDYLQADNAGKRLIDNTLVSVCGWSLSSLLEHMEDNRDEFDE